MSNDFFNRVLAHSKTLGPERAIMLVLANRADKSGICWPGLSLIATDAGITRRTAIRCIQRIRDTGELVIEQRGQTNETQGGIQSTNRYQIILPPVKGSDTESPPIDKVVTHSHQGSDGQSLGVVSDSHQGSDPQSPKPKENPHTEPSLNRKIRAPALERFIRPTPDEVSDYAKSIDFPELDPNQFVDFYGSKGWMVGKSPMKDWKCAVRTWKRGQNAPKPRKILSQEVLDAVKRFNF